MDLTTRPAPTEFPASYQPYVDAAEGPDLLQALWNAKNTMHEVLQRVKKDQEGHRYAPEKWSIKEVVQHVIDAERVFAYRALRFARKDATELPGFEENDYAPASDADRRTLEDLRREYDVVRAGSVLLVMSLPPGAIERAGMANGRPFTVRALGWTIAGHSNHHAKVIAERYLAP